MAKYAAEFNRNLSTTEATIGAHHASSGTQLRRQKLLYLAVGSESTPADAAWLFKAQRYATTVGTSTAITPKPLDKADSSAMLGVAGENHTVEPGYVAGEVMLACGVHQRAPFIYYAPPGAEIVIPAANAEGIGYHGDASTGTPSVSMIVHIEE